MPLRVAPALPTIGSDPLKVVWCVSAFRLVSVGSAHGHISGVMSIHLPEPAGLAQLCCRRPFRGCQRCDGSWHGGCRVWSIAVKRSVEGIEPRNAAATRLASDPVMLIGSAVLPMQPRPLHWAAVH